MSAHHLIRQVSVSRAHGPGAISMQSYCLDACGNLTLPRPPILPLLRSRRSSLALRPPSPSSPEGPASVSTALHVCCGLPDGRRQRRGGGRRIIDESAVRAKRKENVWSIDNDLAAAKSLEEEKSPRQSRQRRRRGRRTAGRRRCGDARVLVSGAMLIEVETVLQMQEPVIKPVWNTFASSISGIWKGVGAVFSPFTAEIEPISLSNKNENLYDCYTLSRIEKVSCEGLDPRIQRKTNWVALNPFGEAHKHRSGDNSNDKHENYAENFHVSDRDLPSYESLDLLKSDVLEEDVIGVEPGLIFFEDGSYSRGPLDIPVGESDESKYFLSPTFKFEQCLVKGCHKRLRIVHTIEFNDGGSSIQITRVALYEEQWVGPATIDDGGDTQFDLKPISQRKRTQSSELTGSWKVFEVSATPIFNEETGLEGELPFVYLCTETLKKRSLPESSVFFGEEETLDLQDVTVLWLPGGVTSYVDVNKDGVLTIGVGWYSDEGINLVMERDYGMDGKLKEVRWKSEVKRRWTDPFPV